MNAKNKVLKFEIFYTSLLSFFSSLIQFDLIGKDFLFLSCFEVPHTSHYFSLTIVLMPFYMKVSMDSQAFCLNFTR